MSYKYLSLTPSVKHILQDKGTEPAFSGLFIEKDTVQGTYICRGCGLALFREDNQFTSHCGWPSFDAELPHAVRRQPDADGRRTEILCARCDGHLGHVFSGEGYTAANLRHCVNSLAIEFVPDVTVLDTEEIIVAAGCFWGVEYLFKQLPGVLLTQVGYSGGDVDYPSYQEVCKKTTGHLEVLRVVYDRAKIDLTRVLQYFFEIHDFSQTDGQGPDVGPQYLSAIFYYTDTQLVTARAIIDELKKQHYTVATQCYPVMTFWPAEMYHQDYYQKNQKQPYCHRWQKIFDESNHD